MAVPGDQVVNEHFPFVPIRLVVAGRSIETEALLDTGFDGAVVMPADFFGPDIHPFIPVSVTPSMKYFCPMKNSTITGSMISSPTAIK